MKRGAAAGVAAEMWAECTMPRLRPPSSDTQAALKSRLSIMRCGAVGETAGVSMPPPPDKPAASQETGSGEAAPAVARKRPAISEANRSRRRGRARNTV
jgi:hypothetical protein